MKEGWKMVKLGEVCTIKGGKRLPQGKSLVSESTPYRYIRVADFKDNGTVIPDEVLYIDEEVYTQISQYTISSNDVYISIAGTIGKTGIIPEILDGANLTENACKLVLKGDLHKKYLYYNTLSYDFEKQIKKATRTTAQPKLALNRLSEIEIPLPPLEEQHRIVSILDASFEKIDALKKNAEENLKNAKALFQQVLAQELKPKEGWVEKKLTDISENLDYKRVPITKNVRKSGKFPYYGASGIVDYVNDYLYDEDLLLISEDGANLLARTTPIAFSVSGKIWVNNHAHVLRFNNLTLQKFVEYFIAGFNITPYVTGMAQPKLNQKALEKIIISFPTDIEEQHRIVQTLDTLCEKCRRLEQVAQQTIRECDALKQSILRQAFSGKL